MINTIFRSVITFECSSCNVFFGVSQLNSKIKCPVCLKDPTLLGEGFIAYNQSVEFKLPEQKNNDSVKSNDLVNSSYPPVLTADDIAEIMGISRRKAYELMEHKDFPLIRIGRLKKVKREDFFKWLDEVHNKRN
jgi:excisionase family DNA binding protein